jgi:tRNA(fMet)-specific endonuclease VapC
MIRYVLDTDILTLLRRNHPAVVQHMTAQHFTEVAITVITVEEQLSGWYSQVRRAKKKAQLAQAYEYLANTAMYLGRLKVLTLTESALDCIDQWRQPKLKVGTQDLRIAAITMENNAILVTRNTQDYQQVPGLTIEDWSV